MRPERRSPLLLASQCAIGGLLFLAVLIPVWVLSDACFHSALTWARVDLGYPDESGLTLSSMPGVAEKYHSASALGPRIAVIILITATLPVLLIVGVARIVLLRHRKWPFALLTCAVIGLVVTCFMYNELLWIGVRNRVSRDLSHFQLVANEFQENWPTEPGQVPEIGKYVAHEQRPGSVLFRVSDNYSFTESFGTFVDRLPDGGIMFSLEPHYLFRVEFHPHGGRPLPVFEAKYTVDTLVRSEVISDHWYLTEYSIVPK